MLKTSKTIVTFALVLTLGAWTLNNLNGNSLAVAAEPLVLEGHSDEVTSVCFSPDGKKALTQSADKTIRIWDAGTGKELLEIKIEGQHRVIPLRFSPDGKKLLMIFVDSATRATRIWARILDAETGKELLKVEEFPAISFSPDSKKVMAMKAVTSTYNITQILDAETGKELLKLEGFAGLCFSPDSKKVAGEATRGRQAVQWSSTQIWDAETGKELLEIKIDGQHRVAPSCFSPDGKKILGHVTSMHLGPVVNVKTDRIWDAKTGKELLKLEGNSNHGSAHSVCFSPDGKKILGYAFADNTARIWDAETGKELLKIKIEGHAYPHCFSPDGKKILKILGYGVYPARIWDVETGKELLEIRATPIYLSPDGKKALGVTGEGDRTTARIWDVE